MTKVDIRRLDSVTTNDTTATQLINENFTALQTAIENTISRDGTTPNFMDADLDLNSYKIINAGTPTNNTDVITKEYFDQYVGDAPGYAAAAEQAANRASTSAQAAQSYSTAAAGAADVAQRARDFIESDPSFIAVSADLLLGDNSSIKKTSEDLTNIDTVAGSIANVNAVGTDITNVNAVAGDLTNIDSVVTNMTDINNVADDLTKIVAVANDLTNIDNVADDLTNIDNVADDLTNIDTVANNITNVNAVAGDIAKVTAVADDLTNIDAVNANKTNIDTVADITSDVTAVAAIASDITTVENIASDVTIVSGIANDVSNVSDNSTAVTTVAGSISDVSAVAGDIANINAVAADLTNIDAASEYAAEAKQWAVGDPSEPVGNSAKHWAEYAESIAEGIGDPANRDLSNLTATGELKFSNLQQQIDAIVASSDVFDIVATYAALQAYDITTVPVNDIIKVLVDETHSGAATYYRCVESGGVKSWSYIGSEGAYYTKGEADVLLAGRANTDLSNLSTTGQAVLDAKQDVATAVNYDNISNCITEIPQDIKLELNNGTLTLKAGSKAYKAGGESIVINSDINSYFNAASLNKLIMVYDTSTNSLSEYIQGSNAVSSPTAPSTSAYQDFLWFDTTNNVLKITHDSGSTWTEIPLPIALASCTTTDGFTSIDQVFNGFGYIGSTVFVLPGVKGLIPNGRNADGTLKNIEISLDSVITYQVTSNGDRDILLFTDKTMGRVTKAELDEEKNYLLLDGVLTKNCMCFAHTTSTSSSISYFTSKTAFHAVDYNDAALKQDFQVVTALPASPTAGVFYFVKE